MELNQALLIFEFENASNVICINMQEVKNCTVEKKYDSIVIGNERKAKFEPHLRSIGLNFLLKIVANLFQYHFTIAHQQHL